MNGKWFEVFRTGSHTDSNGLRQTWTEQDLDTIVAKYNGQTAHEAPLVVGHPTTNSPAFGWTEALKREGQVLFAKAKDVMPAFADAVKGRTYPKRSISLYPDMTLRHIGFLGGMPPAVKGLADIAFKSGEEAITYEFADPADRTMAGIFRRLREFFIGRFGQEAADQVLPDDELTGLQIAACRPDEDMNPGMGTSPQFREEIDMNKEEVQALIKEALTGATQQFAELLKPVNETITSLKTEVAGMQKQFAEGEDAAARREFTTFCEGLKTRILPAEIPTIVDQMMNLRKAPAVEFSEGSEKKSRSAVDDYKLQLTARAETVQFGEFATGERAGHRQEGTEDAQAIAREAQEFMDSEAKAGRTITIADAVSHVRRDAAKGGAK